MEQVLFAYGLPKETVTAIMVLYKNTKAIVRSPDGDTDVIDIVAGISQGDSLGSYLFILCQDYVLWTPIDKIKWNLLTLKTAIIKRYLAETMTDADYADDLVHLANTPAQPECLLHILEQAAGIGL